MMQASIFTFVLLCTAQVYGFESCDECLETIPLIGTWIHESAGTIASWLEENYCPTVEDEECALHVNEMYPTMLEMIAEEFIILNSVR